MLLDQMLRRERCGHLAAALHQKIMDMVAF